MRFLLYVLFSECIYSRHILKREKRALSFILFWMLCGTDVNPLSWAARGPLFSGMTWESGSIPPKCILSPLPENVYAIWKKSLIQMHFLMFLHWEIKVMFLTNCILIFKISSDYIANPEQAFSIKAGAHNKSLSNLVAYDNNSISFCQICNLGRIQRE